MCIPVRRMSTARAAVVSTAAAAVLYGLRRLQSRVFPNGEHVGLKHVCTMRDSYAFVAGDPNLLNPVSEVLLLLNPQLVGFASGSSDRLRSYYRVYTYVARVRDGLDV